MTGLFEFTPRSDKTTDKALLSKSATLKSPTVTMRGSKNLAQKIATMKDSIERYLGDKRDDYICIRDEKSLSSYIDKCIENGVVAIDTETTGLNPLSCEIVGFSMFTPFLKACYVPLNHKSYITGDPVKDQLSVDSVKLQLERLITNYVKTVWFNAKFDMRVLKNCIGVNFIPYYCGYIASRLLNENEPEKGLKALHKKYVLEDREDAFSFGQLFNDVSFDLVPIDVGYLYAARDAQVTFELYEFQLPYLTLGTVENEEQELQGVQNVFWNIEMPIVKIIADMEDLGVKFDFEKQRELSVKYHELQDAKEKEFYSELDKYTNKDYSISSSFQLANLFYDDLGLLKPVVDKKSGKMKRTVDEEALKSINHPLANIILEYRGYAKLISTYIDKMAVCAELDGRVHGEFNQVGADTGRFSSTNPNLQNIPSHNAEIRTMFTASDGYIMMSSDYSGQEPRMTACMSGDEEMLYEYNNGIDPYVTLASIAFDMPYDECKEFRADGSVNKEGKKRRKKAKVLLLAVTYGAGLKTVADGIGCSEDKARDIMKRVFKNYPKLLSFKEESERMAFEKGYVSTYWGRKRRLPDMSLPEYEFNYIKGSGEVPESVKAKYQKLLQQRTGYKKAVFQQANRDGIYIIDNTSKIALAQRQCVNARIQGSSADMTKMAMINVATNERLHELGFRLLIQVHDELIGECPKENAEECSKLFAQCMVDAAKDLPITTKCDVELMSSWSM